MFRTLALTALRNRSACVLSSYSPPGVFDFSFGRWAFPFSTRSFIESLDVKGNVLLSHFTGNHFLVDVLNISYLNLDKDPC